MASEWFVKTDKGIAGPFSTGQMVEFARSGKIRSTTLIRKGADGSWRPAERIRGLLDSSTTSTSTPPTLSLFGHRVDPTWAFAASVVAAGMLLSSCLLVIGLRPSSPPETASTVGSSAPIRTGSNGFPPVKPGEREGAASPELSVAATGSNAKTGEKSTDNAVAAPLTEGVATTDSRSQTAGKPATSERPANKPEDASKTGTNPRPQPVDDRGPASPAAKAPKPRSIADVIAEVEPSVALIEGSRSSGTGFVIDAGVVLTNKHVLQTECVENLRVYFPSAAKELQGPQAVTLLFKDPKRDLAYLRVVQTPPPLRITADHRFKRGQEVTVVGNPGMTDGKLLVNAVSKGVMSTEATIEGRPYFQLGISINAGNSGGPVLDSEGNVIGVVTLKDKTKEGMGFCIPPKEFAESITQMKAVTDDQIPKINDDHDFQVVLFEITMQGIMAKVRMDSLVTAMTRAIDSGGTANDGVEAVRRESGLQVTSQEQTNFLQDSVKRIVRNTRYPEATRQRLADFWATVQAMVSYAQQPRGSLNSYREKARELDDDFSRQMQPLRVLIGSPFD